MTSAPVSRMTIELEASQKKLDRGLDEAEEKSKGSGKRMEKNLALDGVASGLVKAFAAIGVFEAGLRGATGLVELLKGDASAAIEAFERMPFGIGSAVSAGRELFTVISGSREQAEKITREFGRLPELARNAQTSIESMLGKLAPPQSRNERAASPINEHSSQINKQMADLTVLINRAQQLEAERFNAEQGFDTNTAFRWRDLTALGVDRLGATRTPLGEGEIHESLRSAMVEGGIDAKNMGELIAEMRRLRTELFELGLRVREQGITSIQQRELDQLNDRTREKINASDPFEQQRQQLEDEFAELISSAITEAVADRLRDDLASRLREIDQAQRDAVFERQGFDLELRPDQLRELPGTGPPGGRQEVEDTEANTILGQIRDIGTRMLNTPNTAVLSA